MPEVKSKSLSEEQVLAAHLIAEIFHHNLSLLQREKDAMAESIRFAKVVIETIKSEF